MSNLIAICDLETTGFKADKGHRIVEICVQAWDVDSRTMARELSTLVQPLREIPADASNVHGLYTEDLVDAPLWEKVAPIASLMLSKCKVFVAHNVDFDSVFLGQELIRVGAAVPDIETFCTMQNGRWATANGKTPKLSELCWALSVPYDAADAHRASYDVTKTAQCLWAGIDAGFYKLPV